jgi:uncharacterized membrane protein YccC
MTARRFSSRLFALFEHSVLTMDVARALRSSVAFTVAWIVCLWTGHPVAAVFAATAGQNLALVDVRGDYRVRLAVLLTMMLVMAGSVMAGRLTGNNVGSATLMVGALALLGSAWRHLSADYGPNLAVVSALLFLFALAQPGDWQAALQTVKWVLLGCAGGLGLQLLGWFVRPQHPVRHAVAESWVAASDLMAAMRAGTGDGQLGPSEFAKKESVLRTTVDQTLKAIEAATTPGRTIFFQHLDDATQIAARLATRVSALNTALEPIRSRTDFAQVAPTLDILLQALANAGRSAALTLITHRAEQFLALEVRLRRCSHLARILDTRLAALPEAGAEVALARQMLDQAGQLFPEIGTTIQATVDHGAAHATFALRLPELSGLSLHSLSSWVNPAPELDPVLVRHALRIALLMMVAVAIYKWFNIPRGYWIAFTAVIVLQPDYGSTYEKAGQRIVGTLAGCVLASFLLWLKPPEPVLILLTAISAFFFAYYLKRRYGLAVYFVTLMLVLITDAVEPVTWAFTRARLLSTVAGGGMALFAALYLWPKWEQQQFPKILAAALRANRNYLAAIVVALAQGAPFTGAVILRKREAERANNLTAASLQRMLGEPAERQQHLESAAALTACNKRLTRAATVLAVHLNQRKAFHPPEFLALGVAIGGALETLAMQIEKESAPAKPVPFPPESRPPAGDAAASLVYGQLARIVTEIEAMVLAQDAAAPTG